MSTSTPSYQPAWSRFSPRTEAGSMRCRGPTSAFDVGDGHGHDRTSHADERDGQSDAGQPAAAGVAHDAAVGGDAVEEPDQRDGDDAVEDRGEHQGVDGVDADEVQAQTDDHGRGDDAVEVPALLRR